MSQVSLLCASTLRCSATCRGCSSMRSCSWRASVSTCSFSCRPWASVVSSFSSCRGVWASMRSFSCSSWASASSFSCRALASARSLCDSSLRRLASSQLFPLQLGPWWMVSIEHRYKLCTSIQRFQDARGSVVLYCTHAMRRTVVLLVLFAVHCAMRHLQYTVHISFSVCCMRKDTRTF